jgi:hypothetical protein
MNETLTKEQLEELSNGKGEDGK